MNKLAAGFHLPETLAGAALGAGTGLLADRLLHKPKDRWGWRAGLAGAALGAGAGAGAGWAGRRYVSNKVLPMSYDRDPLGQLAPNGVGEVWDAVVNDKPQYDPARVANLQKAEPDRWQDILGGRRELFRRQLGAHTLSPDDYFAPNPDGTYSLNADRPDAGLLASRLLLPNLVDAERISLGRANPATLAQGETRHAASGEAPRYLLGSVLGGIKPDHINPPPPQPSPGFDVTDRWDVTLSDAEKGFLRQGLGKAVTFDRSWLTAPYSGEAGKVDYARPDSSNGQVLRSTLLRGILDQASAENPVVSQRYRYPADRFDTIVPQTGAGRPYPGYLERP